jgi:lipoprotein-anchoring transpeptidase ErfK/SrfK
VLTLTGQVHGQAVMPYNDIWFQTNEGFIYSSTVQPVQNIKNDPLPDLAAKRFWGEISVPFTDSRATPDVNGRRGMRLEYSTVYRVIAAVQDKANNWWYRLQDGVSYSPGPYILASDIRRIDPSEVTPLSPDVDNKRIEVNLKKQTITAFENDQPVLTHLICSGAGNFGTPRGTHKVLFKTPTSRMIGGSGSSFYDLPGVPFCTFFTWSGVAIHGTYWHNDYGRPRSHGCVNVPSDVSKWFWRWTLPTAPYDNKVYYSPRNGPATKIVVF